MLPWRVAPDRRDVGASNPPSHVGGGRGWEFNNSMSASEFLFTVFGDVFLPNAQTFFRGSY